MQDLKIQKMKEALKAQLKKRKIKYEDLAEQMNCSVPTIKRILGPEELTLSRLLQLCEIAHIDLGELEMLTQKAGDRDLQFTPEQEQFLAKNPSYMAYFMQLLDGSSPQQIAKKHDLTTRSTDKYLIALERLELIRVTGKLKVKPNFDGLPTFGSGPLAKLYFEKIIACTARFFTDVVHLSLQNKNLKTEQKTGSSFTTMSLKVSKASYETFMSQQKSAIQDFERLSRFEEKSMAEDQLMSVVILSAGALTPHDYPGLKQYENVFGDITNV